MRLTPLEIQVIKEEAARHFGADAVTWLFGSRVNDRARGGDVDLYIETEMDTGDYPDDLLRATREFRYALLCRLGDRQIDIVTSPRGGSERRIVGVARATGVIL